MAACTRSKSENILIRLLAELVDETFYKRSMEYHPALTEHGVTKELE